MPTPSRTSRRPSPGSIAAAPLVAALMLACTDAGAPPEPAGALAAVASATTGEHRQYGAPIQVGEGRARTYVVLDAKRGNAPVEVGVALDERALDGLPAPMPGHEPGGHADTHEYLLPMPALNSTRYQFMELDWNPAGHEPESIYDKPHFDFHFYTISLAERNAIDPAVDPAFQQKAANLPPDGVMPPFYFTPLPAVAVPRMGVHWLDVRSPELPPALEPFTTTFILGSWDGRTIFDEPMITRAHLLAKRTATDPAVRDQVIPLPTAERVVVAGWYPSAYRITWDEQAREYRIALTRLAWRD
jgi:hypothetical protein